MAGCKNRLDILTGRVVSLRSKCTSVDTLDPYVYIDKGRDAVCLRGFQDLFESEQLFDVTLRVGGKDFRCHKALLASSSDYFRAMFTNNLAETDSDVVTISDVDSTSMDLVLKYLYTGQVELQSDTVQNLLSVANLFLLQDLKEGCATFMAKKLDDDNCIGIHFFAQSHECEYLEYQAWDCITENFESVSFNSEFLELSSANLVEIIKYDDILAKEEEVFEAVMRWLTHKSDDRQVDLYSVFSHIRFTLIDRFYLFDKVRNSPLLQGNPKLTELIDEVIQYKLLKERWIESDTRLEPRYGDDFCRVIVYTSYLDDEKKQVLQLYGQRSDEVTTKPGNVLVDLHSDIENPVLLVTGDNDLYLAGGDQWTGNTFYKYFPDDKDFEKLTDMPSPRKQFCLTQVDSCIYAIGGYSKEGNLATVDRYNEDQDEWEAVAPMPKALRCCTSLAFQGKLYVFGGECEKLNKKKIRGKTELTRQALCYDPQKDKWTFLAEMFTPRALAGCTVFNKKIYVIGGFGTITESWIKDKSPEHCLQSVEVYDPLANSWQNGPDLPVPLCAMGIIKYYGTIYILGGENDEDISHSVYYLNDGENRWEHKDDMVTGVTETTIHSSYAVLNVDMDVANII